MARFVLVHGSGQNASCRSRVGGVLQSRGHSVAAPELPKQAPDRGLQAFAAEIAKSITGPQSVVVGHSISGVFLPLVPRIRRCALLVFLAAVIPEPGKSARDPFTEEPSMFGDTPGDAKQARGVFTGEIKHEPTSTGQDAKVGMQRLYFRVKDLGAQRSRVVARGNEAGEVKKTDWMDMFIVRDPDGNEIVFAETDPERHATDPWHVEKPARGAGTSAR